MVDLEQEAKAERRRYYREWRRKNRDKVRHANRLYWIRRAARIAQEESDGRPIEGKEAHPDGC